eukprot:SAG31_NODE_37_length_31616_cov_38.688359_4_plen_285_part_00
MLGFRGGFCNGQRWTALPTKLYLPADSEEVHEFEFDQETTLGGCYPVTDVAAVPRWAWDSDQAFSAGWNASDTDRLCGQQPLLLIGEGEPQEEMRKAADAGGRVFRPVLQWDQLVRPLLAPRQFSSSGRPQAMAKLAEVVCRQSVGLGSSAYLATSCRALLTHALTDINHGGRNRINITAVAELCGTHKMARGQNADLPCKKITPWAQLLKDDVPPMGWDGAVDVPRGSDRLPNIFWSGGSTGVEKCLGSERVVAQCFPNQLWFQMQNAAKRSHLHQGQRVVSA